MFHFYTPGKFKKTPGFLTFSAGIDMEYWLETGQRQYNDVLNAFKVNNKYY